MITKIRLQNYRSFVDAEAKLSPFTLVIGANGSGKSNFAQAFAELADPHRTGPDWVLKQPAHINHPDEPRSLIFEFCDGTVVDTSNSTLDGKITNQGSIKLFKIDPSCVGRDEEIKPGQIESDGSNIVSVLDGLKNGDREDLFDEIETQLGNYIPTIEKLSSKICGAGKKFLQVREKDMKEPIPLSELSEGTRLLLTILTIVYQEDAPEIIILEDIDYGLHPRLFSDLVSNLREVAEKKDIQIIATTHNPYMVDQFDGDEEAVLIVEKENGESTITDLASRLETGDTVDGALGALWFGGFVGGVPAV